MNQEIEGKLQDIFQRFGFIRTPEQEAKAIKAIQKLVVSTVPEKKDDVSKQRIENAWAHSGFKQALTEKKLCVPMSYDTIYDILNRRKETHKAMLATGTPEKEIFHELTETLYQTQFGGNK